MAQLSFTNLYGVVNGQIVTGGAFAYTLDETVVDGVFDIDAPEALNITGSGRQFNYDYAGSNGAGEIAITGVPGYDIVFFTNSSYVSGSAAPTFSATDFVVCFTQGTLIETEDGPKAIEEITEGDLIVTRDNGLQPVRWIGSRTLSAQDLALSPQLSPITIAAGTMGNNRDLTVSPEHRMLATGWRAAVTMGVEEALVPAKSLLNDSTITRSIPQDGVTYWHVLFDKHEIISAEGSWAESLNPDATAMTGLDDASRAEFLSLFPQFEGGEGLAPARPLMAGGGRLLEI